MNKRLVFSFISIFAIFGLLVVVFNLITENQSLKYSVNERKAIPHIDLTYTLERTDAVLSYEGVIKGFVVFDNKQDQPKDLWQYYIIEPTYLTDSNSNQIFSLEDIVVVGSLAPKSLGKSDLYIKSDSRINNEMVLVDEYGNQFFINQNLRMVTMKDVTGDSTSLITSDVEYSRFVKGIIK